MTIIHRHTLKLAIFFVYFSLILHDRNLYPNLSITMGLLLSTLRLALLAVPVCAGLLLLRGGISRIMRAAAFACWLFFLPYTIYSVTEIRHVSELCRLGGGDVYTGQCISFAWTLLPILVYAIAGTMAYVFTLSKVSSALFPISSRKQLFILFACFYCAFASAFGLATRFNMWAAIIRPGETIARLGAIIGTPAFQLNTLLFTIFFAGIFFFMNRAIRQGSQWL